VQLDHKRTRDWLRKFLLRVIRRTAQSTQEQFTKFVLGHAHCPLGSMTGGVIVPYTVGNCGCPKKTEPSLDGGLRFANPPYGLHKAQSMLERVGLAWRLLS
jgi:hypothetical protein